MDTLLLPFKLDIAVGIRLIPNNHKIAVMI
jgi:hypothetical protein